jgi:hypothetical protein
VSLPTLPDLKEHNNQLSAADDDELQNHLDAAVEVVEGLIGPVAEDTVTETHYGLNSSVLVLKQMPVGALTAVSSRAGSTTTALTLSDYELDPATGLVRLANGSWFYGNFTVTYTTGRADVPASIRLAILIVAEHLWETQRMPGQSRDSAPAGFGGLDGIPDASSSGRGFLIPNRAEELLRPYMWPVIA